MARSCGVLAGFLVGCAVVGALGRPALGMEKDATLESTARLFSRSMTDLKDTALSRSREAGQVITALRSTKDKDLLPLFAKLEESTQLENQIYGMVARAVLSKDSTKIDFKMLFKTADSSLAGSAIATLIDTETITTPQLEWLVDNAPLDIQKSMAVGELTRRKALKDRTELVRLLKSPEDVVKYYAAVTVLETKDAPEAQTALSTLRDLSAKNDPRQAAVQAVMIVRAQKEKITAAGPWLVQLASDEKNDQGLRYTAVSALLDLEQPDGPRILSEMIEKQHSTVEQVKLGLIALEFAGELKPGVIAPLLQSRSDLAKRIATLAQAATSPNTTDVTAGLLKLIKEGQPIVLDWALASSEHSDADRKMAVRSAIIAQATIVDDSRGRDYERAALAAQRVMEDGGAVGRKLLASLIKGDNRAVSEAVLAGVYRSNAENQSEVVLPAWDALSRSTTEETAANYAALILAREGKAQPLAWLSGMVMGGTVQSQGFRAIAGWYYAKLLGQSEVVMKRALAG